MSGTKIADTKLAGGFFPHSLRNESSRAKGEPNIMTNDQKKSIRVVLFITMVMLGLTIINLISNHGETISVDVRSQLDFWSGWKIS